jgi:hypothetical protein
MRPRVGGHDSRPLDIRRWRGQEAAEAAHEEVGKAVRETIKGLGGAMLEDEPPLDNIEEARNQVKPPGPRS